MTRLKQSERVRGSLDYSARHAPVRDFSGFDPDKPEPGFYAMRLRSDGMLVGIRVWFGPPLDPDTREEMDRGWRWQAEANGRDITLERVWPVCADNPISEAEYRRLSNLQSWGEQVAPGSGVADPRRAVDPLTSPLMF